jgi:hypothetical protein
MLDWILVQILLFGRMFSLADAGDMIAGMLGNRLDNGADFGAAVKNIIKEYIVKNKLLLEVLVLL